MKTEGRNSPLGTLTAELLECGLLTSNTPICERLQSVETKLAWKEIAWFISTRRGGIVRFFEHGVCWQYSRDTYWLSTEDVIRKTMEARSIVRELTGTVSGVTTGQCGGELLKWVGKAAVPQKRALEIMEGAAFGYHECTPGEYPAQQLLDLEAAYFQVLSRLPSLRFSVTSHDEIIENPMPPGELSRWREVLAAVAQCKGLRNAMWGKTLGSLSWSKHYHRGELKNVPPFAGPFQTAGLLTARVVYELCVMAAHDCDAVYAQTDGIICRDGYEPASWQRYNMRYNVKASGTADVRYQHSYRIGNAKTKWFHLEGQLRRSEPRRAIPDRLYASQFL